MKKTKRLRKVNLDKLPALWSHRGVIGAVAKAMAEPLKSSLDYSALSRKLFQIAPLQEFPAMGDLPIYDQDITQEFPDVKIKRHRNRKSK